MGGGVEFSHTGLGIVMECVGFETRVAVLEGHLAIDVEHFVGGIVDAGAAGEDAVAVGGMAPSGVGSGVGCRQDYIYSRICKVLHGSRMQSLHPRK